MKRWMVVLAGVAVLAVGSAAVVMAQTPTPPAAPGQSGWGCGGGAANGNDDPAANPTVQRLAAKIGISAADLASELKAGKSVMDVAGPKGVNEQALVEVLTAPMVEMMNLGTEYGYHDQAQIDAMLKYMAEQFKYQLEQKGNTFGYGMMGSGGMMGGYGGGSGMMGGYSGGSGMMGGYGGGSGMMGGGFRGGSDFLPSLRGFGF